MDKMILRAATFADAQRLYDWRNDPSTRETMHQTAMFDFQSHCDWLQHSLALNTRKLYIAEVDSIPVGTTRTDLADGVTEFSWTIAPQFRGRGFGKRMVGMIIKDMSGPIHVEIKAGNIASIRIAEHVGLRQTGETDGILHFSSPPLRSTG